MLTKREKIILICLIALLLGLAVIPQDIINRYELFFLLVIIPPVGYLIVTDQERKIK